MAVNLEITGLEETLKNLEKIDPTHWKNSVKTAMRADQSQVRSDMRSMAPRKKGITRSSLKTYTVIVGNDNDFSIISSTGPRFDGSSQAWYSHFTELGTPKQKAKLYIRGAGRKNYNKMRDSMINMVKDVVARANGEKK